MRLEADDLRREQRLKPSCVGHHRLNPPLIASWVPLRKSSILERCPDVITFPRRPHHDRGLKPLRNVEVGNPAERTIIRRYVVETAYDHSIKVEVEAAALKPARLENGDLRPPALHFWNVFDHMKFKRQRQVAPDPAMKSIDVFLSASEVIGLVDAHNIEH